MAGMSVSGPGGGFYTGSEPMAHGGAQAYHRGPQSLAAAGFPQHDWNAGGSGGALGGDDDYSNEPPLLEELGINFEHIYKKVTAVLLLQKEIDPTIMHDADMAGPLVFVLSLGFCLLLTGKIHFGYIYGFGAMGCCAMYVIVNLMAHGGSLDLSRTFSVMGYSLLPIVLLSAVAILVDLRGGFGTVLGLAAVAWCTLASARLFDASCGMREQKWLIAYPAFLVYACFALITIF